ncbi:hypothetical protein [Muricoccus pecuniae]|uniref:Uncharacterized protein n=1 Tax=Muricoccus pecuniae TaxID=693023 RepID=A0A840YDR1_9PROT|nr:hypothetical protein [Roseomonas pecuniae]MBB5694281.1 hypothetical protein [Roseomonas pecuniae]
MSPRALSNDALQEAIRDAFEALDAASERALEAQNIALLHSRRDVLMEEARRRGIRVPLHPRPICIEPWWVSYTPEYDDPIRAALDAYKAASRAGAEPAELDRLWAVLRRAQAAKLAVIYPSQPGPYRPLPFTPAAPRFMARVQRRA